MDKGTQIAWADMPTSIEVKKANVHRVRFITSCNEYNAGDTHGMDLRNALKYTNGVGIDDVADLDPEKLPPAVLCDKAAFDKAYAKDAKLRDIELKNALAAAEQAAQKAQMSKDKALAAVQHLDAARKFARLESEAKATAKALQR